ncbi:putative L-galactonate transporter [Streptomyces sp. RB17]|uniref:MFS transporter n=1 Tax=Streptomyces sp. RB17 TaxID=2585197 RepID=UPI00129726B9|nr:MFS transporter [Streptomyces sp. RB17]MQY34045.1 putative L-galactonate transporter [Streptomyces sp. RB17]
MGSPSLRPGRGPGVDASGPATPPVSRRYAWYVFALAFALALTDYIDRQIIVSAFPFLKDQWGLSDTQLGALVSVVSVTVGLGALPLARLADRWSRAKSVALMGTVWSLAALGCAISGNYGQMVAARAAVGAGEAGYGPAGGALLASLFPQRKRSTVAGAFLSAAPIGAVFGVFLGGLMVGQLGWRITLGVFSVPGAVLALLFLKVRERHAPGTDAVATGQDAPAVPVGLRAVMAELFRARTAVPVYLASALQLAVLSTLFAWLPSYLTRAYGYTDTRAGAVSAVAILASAVGTFVLGGLADRASATRARNKLLFPAAFALLALALLTSAFGAVPTGPLQLCLIVVGTFAVTSVIGPVPAVVMDIVDSSVRATALGMLVLVQNLFGLAVGPLLTGRLSDAYGLPTALTVMPLFCIGSAAALWYASRTYEQDLNAQTRRDAQSGEAL